MSDRVDTEALAEEWLEDVISKARDEYPRRSDDMDSGDLADRILNSSWLAARDARVRADALAGVRFRVEVACEGYANLTADDIPVGVFDEDDYMAGAAQAADAIRDALAEPSVGSGVGEGTP